MQGRFSRGIYFVLTDLEDPAQEQEFNYWYNYIHIPDIVSKGILQNPTRYEALEPKPPETLRPRAQYLTIWETDRVDLDQVVNEYRDYVQQLQSLGRVRPGAREVWSEVFQSIGPTRKPQGKPVTGIQVVMTTCTDPGKEDEFNDWYDNVHLDHSYDTGLYQMAYRYETYNTPKPGEGKFVVIYETAEEDPAAAHAEIMGKHAPRFVELGEITPYLERVWSGSLRLVWPLSA